MMKATVQQTLTITGMDYGVADLKAQAQRDEPEVMEITELHGEDEIWIDRAGAKQLAAFLMDWVDEAPKTPDQSPQGGD
jgi:hypothetical protein